MEYNHFSEALADLKALKEKGIYADLSSSETSMQDAMKLCKGIMQILSRCSDNYLFLDDLNADKAKEFSDTLKSMGCVSWEQANQKFKSGTKNMDEAMHLKDSIEFPLSLMHQLIDKPLKTFECGIGIGGGLWSETWLNTQNEVTLEQ